MTRTHLVAAAALAALLLPCLADADTERFHRRVQRTQTTALSPTTCPPSVPATSTCSLRTRFRANELVKQGTNPDRRGVALRWSIQQYLCVDGICSTLVLADRGVAPRHSLRANNTRRFTTKPLVGKFGTYQYSYVTEGKVNYRDHQKTQTGPIPPCVINRTTYKSGWGTNGTGTIAIDPAGPTPAYTVTGPGRNVRVTRTQVTQLEPNCP
ncbi:MAG: hypothetical protein ACKOCT_04260 [Alphaproteobacteria bacterium]